jgi:hypothetical protein
MHCSVLENKGQRMINNKNIMEIYQIIKGILPYWTKFIYLSQT